MQLYADEDFPYPVVIEEGPDAAEPQSFTKSGVTEARLAVSRADSRETAKRTIKTRVYESSLHIAENFRGK